MEPLHLAWSFFTRWPAPPSPREDGSVDDATLGASVSWWATAAVPVGVGAALAGGTVGLAVSPLAGAVAAVAASAWLSRGLHLDGLSDCFDGLLCHGGADEAARARRLEVMHDPRAGALAAAGLCLFLLAKVALVAATADRGSTAQALWAAAVVGRAPLAWELLRTPSATPGRGLAATFQRLAPPQAPLRNLVAGSLLLTPVLFLDPARALTATALALAAALLWRRRWCALLGGVNGDVLGASVEIRELCVLLVYAARPFG